MTESENIKTPATIEEPPRVIRVLEGDSLGAERLFAVVLNRCAGEDLGVVATAVDPGPVVAGSQEPVACPVGAGKEAEPCRIPVPGSPHPTIPGLVARPPDIYCVGMRDKEGGAMLATATNFYNVRVRYAKGEMLNAQCPMLNDKEGPAT